MRLLSPPQAPLHPLGVGMAKGTLAEERSRLKLQAVELAARDAQLAELSEQRAAARAKLGARAEHADELHERLRLSALAGTEAEAELMSR